MWEQGWLNPASESSVPGTKAECGPWRATRRNPSVHPLAGALGAAAATAGLKGKLIKAGNDVYAVTILAGWCLALIGAANSVKGEELSHALLDGQLYFTSAHHLVAAACLLIAVAAGLPWLSKRLLLLEDRSETAPGNP